MDNPSDNLDQQLAIAFENSQKLRGQIYNVVNELDTLMKSYETFKNSRESRSGITFRDHMYPNEADKYLDYSKRNKFLDCFPRRTQKQQIDNVSIDLAVPPTVVLLEMISEARITKSSVTQ